MASLILFEPDLLAISVAPDKIKLPLPLLSSSQKGNGAIEDLTIVFGRAEPSEAEKNRIQVIAKAQGKDIISRTHFSVTYNASEKSYEVRDLNSTNGVYINNIRVSSCYLQHSDILQIGGVNTNIIGVGERLPEECSSMSCIKYQYIDDNAIDKSKKFKDEILSKSNNNSQNSNDKNNKKTNNKTNNNTSNNNTPSIIINNKHKNEHKEQHKEHQKGQEKEQKELETLKNELYQNKNQQDNITRELKQDKRRLEGEVNDLKVKLVKYEKSKNSGTIDKVDITSSLECPLCGDIILNAAVLVCSHGFCMSCIESYWRKDETNKVARLQRKVTKKVGYSTCPVCNDNVPPEPDKLSSTSATTTTTSKGINESKLVSFEHLYHRSLHLDSVCSLLYDDIDVLKERERRGRGILTSYGIDVDRSRTLKADDDDEEEMKVDDINVGENKTDPLCSLCNEYHDPFVNCALNDETEDEEDDDDDNDD